MKIAFIVSAFPTLSETFILNQITGLIDRGHEVDIFAGYNPNEEKTHPAVEKYQLMEHVYYFNMPVNKIKRVLKGVGLLVMNFRKAPARLLRTLNVFKYGKDALSLRLLYAVIPFLGKEQKYDIIHCHFGPNGSLGVLLYEIGAVKGKIITTFHGYDVNVIKQNDPYSHLFRLGHLFTVNTNFTKEKAIELGGPPEKILKLPVGLPLDTFHFKQRVIQPGNDIKILTVARLVEKKGLEYSIRAVAKIVGEHPDWSIRYLIAGSGPLEGKLKSLISELEIGNRVKLLGPCTQNEIKKLYQESHIFILSSVTAENGDREGQALVLQEAQAVGLPVLSTLHNGIPEGILDGKSGFLVPERDVDALAERLEYLIEHPEIWPEMGKAGRKFVEEHYDINKLNNRLVEIYQKLLDGELP